MVDKMSEETPGSQEPATNLPDPMESHDEEAPCLPSLWKAVIVQAQNSLNDKIAQYVLLALANVSAALSVAQRETYPHVGALLLALPLILFAPTAGWLADRFSKRSIFVWCSVVQFGSMLAIALCFYFNWFWAATFCFFLLATQATLFGPAKGGIVKELVGEQRLNWANSWVQATGLMAIVVGPWLGGALFKWAAPHFPGEPQMAAFWPALWLAVAAIGPVLLSLRMRRTPSHSQDPPRWALLWEHFFHLKDLLSVRRLRLASLGVSFFWFSATLLALLLIQVAQTMTPDQSAHAELGGYLLVWVGLGIATGSVIVGLVSTDRIELGLIPLGGLGMAFGSIAAATAPFGGLLFNTVLFIIGVSSAVFLVPLNAYLQDLVEPAKRGRQLAASGLLDSLGMFFGVIVQYLWKAVGLGGATGARLQFLLLSMLCLVTAVYVVRIIPQNFLRFVALALIKLTYRVRVLHADRVPAKGGALLIANHVSYIDAFIISAACERKVRFIASDQFHKMRFIGPFLTLFDVVPVSPTRAKDAIVSVSEAVAAGDLVCIFPEGQITRTGFISEIRKGFELIARRGHVPVLPVYLDDLWGSLMSFERGAFFKKWPKRYAYQVGVSFAPTEPPETATADWARQQFRALSAEAIISRGELKTRLEVAIVLELCRKPWRIAAWGNHKFTRAMLLAEAWTLAQRWTDRISGDRVAVLAGGTSGLVATLALRLAGFTPISVSPGLLSDLPSLAVHLEAHGISAVVHSAPPTQAYDLTWINLTTEIAGLDSLRLASKMASIYLLPKTLQAWWMRRKQPHFTTRQEAIGWLAPDASGTPTYRSLTHREILLQCEQLSSLDVIREGEGVFCPDGYASFPGSLLGLWHPMLQGATLLTEPHRQNDAQIFLGDDALAAALAVSPPNHPAGARAFYCFNHEATSIAGTFSEALESRWHLTICPARYDEATQHLVSISLPNPPVTTSTGDPQTGHKPGSNGRLLPGYRARTTDGGLTLTSPDGLEIEMPDSRLDSEDFLFTTDRE